MESSIVSASSDVWIEESSRPYALSVQEVVESGAIRRFNINTQRVENAIARIMIAIDMDDPDTILAAVSIVFLMMVWCFKLRLHSVLQFAENFLTSGEKKPTCWALRQMLNDDYDNKVMRYETVKLSKPVNVTKVMQRGK